LPSSHSSSVPAGSRNCFLPPGLGLAAIERGAAPLSSAGEGLGGGTGLSHPRFSASARCTSASAGVFHHSRKSLRHRLESDVVVGRADTPSGDNRRVCAAELRHHLCNLVDIVSDNRDALEPHPALSQQLAHVPRVDILTLAAEHLVADGDKAYSADLAPLLIDVGGLDPCSWEVSRLPLRSASGQSLWRRCAGRYVPSGSRSRRFFSVLPLWPMEV